MAKINYFRISNAVEYIYQMCYFRSICILFIFLIYVTSNKGIAQDFNALPKLLPSYTENFIDYKSNPSMCFDNAFFDDKGRMWLIPCTGSLTGLHLFQFDGYEFNSIRGTLDTLPTDTKFVLMDKKQQQLVGYVNEPNNLQIVIYILQSGELRTYLLPPLGKGFFYKMFFDEDEVLNLYYALDNHLIHFQLKREQLVFIRKIDKLFTYPGYLINFLGKKENGIWHMSPAFDKVYQINVDTGKRTSFQISGVDFSKIKKGVVPFSGKLFSFDSAIYLTLHIIEENRSILLKLDKGNNQFSLVEEVPVNAENILLFNDNSGNMVYLFRYQNGEYKAILEDNEGIRYDYSTFFSSAYVKGRSPFLVSPDFKKQLLVCHSQGILLQTAKASGAITHILPGIPIRNMVELPGQQTLISTQQSNKTFIYDNKTGQVKPWNNTDCSMSWAKLLKDKDGYIWGVGNQGFVKYDPVSNTCEKFTAAITKNVMALIGEDRIAFIQGEQLAFFDMKSKKVLTFNMNGTPVKISGYVHDMLYSRSGLLWVATTKGMIKIDLVQQTSEVIGLKEPFRDFRFLCIHEDEKGRLWMGTPLGGIHIYDPETRELKVLDSKAGLPSNTVASILAGNNGDKWVGTYNGISIIAPDGQLIANLYEEDGLINRESNRYANLKTSDGKLLIGTVSGLNVIDPQKVKRQLSVNEDLKIYLTSLSYFDETTGKKISKRYGLDNTLKVTLPADKRNLNLEFALSNYFKPEFNQYAYQLEGVSDEWIPIGNHNSLNLNNLPSGRYRLLIKGSDGAGNWTAQPQAIIIHAREHFYKDPWFYLLCLALLSGLAFLWIYRLRHEVRKATKTILEDKKTIEQQAEKLLELDQTKSRFFTNISHEFRTPLTIISGMVDQIREKPDLWLERGTKMVKQNTLGLLNLVNQILDLRKLEANELKVDMVNGDLVKYLRYLAESHQSFAASKGLQLHFLTDVEEIKMDYDPDKLLRIVSNLLSNAIKFTPQGGNIYLLVEAITEGGNPALLLRVQDTGVGIPSEDLPNIFGRFYQVDDSMTRKGQGTGIGLALTQELVKLLGGNIAVKSVVGEGTTFTMTLPILNESAVKANNWDESGLAIEKTILEPALVNLDTVETEFGTAGKPTLLIVEDNPDVQQYLIACLEDHYLLEIANDGQEGIDKAIEQVPDLIVSDVMMPEKDGYELTATLKTDERTDHIPIVLLTAKADIDSKISGLEKGADAYLAKPFDKRELLVRLEKLLELRKKLQARYAQLPDTTEEAETLHAPDHPFLQKFYALIEAELSNAELGMDEICQKLGMSRSQVFKKLKALTGKSASSLIRSYRLHQGKKLLATTDLTISEVAYEVGFTSLNYFSVSFFEEFGERPSSFRK